MVTWLNKAIHVDKRMEMTSDIKTHASAKESYPVFVNRVLLMSKFPNSFLWFVSDEPLICIMCGMSFVCLEL